MKTIHCFFLSVAILFSHTTFAEEAPPVSGVASLSLANSYVLRGRVYNQDPVIQPTLDLSTPSGLGVILWENLDLTDYEGKGLEGKPTEIDVILHYLTPLDKDDTFSLDLGVGQYSYPNLDVDGSEEAYVSLLSALPFNPSLSFWWDFGQVNSWYATVALSPSWHISALFPNLECGIQASLAMSGEEYNQYYFNHNENALNDLTAKAWLSFPVWRNLYLKAEGGYMWLPDEDVRSQANALYGKDHAFVSAITTGWKF